MPQPAVTGRVLLALPVFPQVDRAGSLRAFARAVTTGDPPESSGRDNLGSIALMQTAMAATQDGPLPVECGG